MGNLSPTSSIYELRPTLRPATNDTLLLYPSKVSGVEAGGLHSMRVTENDCMVDDEFARAGLVTDTEIIQRFAGSLPSQPSDVTASYSSSHTRLGLKSQVSGSAEGFGSTSKVNKSINRDDEKAEDSDFFTIRENSSALKKN